MNISPRDSRDAFLAPKQIWSAQPRNLAAKAFSFMVVGKLNNQPHTPESQSPSHSRMLAPGPATARSKRAGTYGTRAKAAATP